MNTPQLSVIVPVYNTQNYIDRCIQSLLLQKVKDIEIILVDDGSKDDSGKKCEEYALKDSRIKVIHQENKGVSAARNRGLELAQGTYIGFTDSDDWVEPDMFSEMIERMCESQADVCYCTGRFEGEKLERYDSGSLECMTASQALLELARGRFISPVYTALYRHKGLLHIRFHEDITYWEDLDFQIYVLLAARKIVLEEKPFYHVMHREDSATAVKVNRNNLSCLKIAEKLECADVPAKKRWVVNTIRYKILADLILSAAYRGVDQREQKRAYRKLKETAKKCCRNMKHTRFTTVKGRIWVHLTAISPPISCFLLNKVLRVYCR